MTSAGIQLFQTLKTRLGERETKVLIDYVDTTLKENNKEIHETNLRTLVTKEDLWATREELKNDIAQTREELKGDIALTREELKGDIAQTREELKGDIALTREELKGDIALTREELKGDIALTREELKGDISRTREDLKDVKSDTIRWMFALFITMMLAILGLYFKH
jgi:hypothetical protein